MPGDFNIEPIKDAEEEFMKVYNLKNLVKGPTTLKIPRDIDLILIEKNKSFKISQIIETGISDFYKMILIVLKVYLTKKGLSVIQYHDYKVFLMTKLEIIYLMNWLGLKL